MFVKLCLLLAVASISIGLPILNQDNLQNQLWDLKLPNPIINKYQIGELNIYNYYPKQENPQEEVKEEKVEEVKVEEEKVEEVKVEEVIEVTEEPKHNVSGVEFLGDSKDLAEKVFLDWYNENYIRDGVSNITDIVISPFNQDDEEIIEDEQGDEFYVEEPKMILELLDDSVKLIDHIYSKDQNQAPVNENYSYNEVNDEHNKNIVINQNGNINVIQGGENLNDNSNDEQVDVEENEYNNDMYLDEDEDDIYEDDDEYYEVDFEDDEDEFEDEDEDEDEDDDDFY